MSGLKIPLEELAKVHQMMNKIPFMSHLTQSEIMELAYHIAHRHFSKGETIGKQGDHGRKFYIISKGQVGVFREGFFSRKKVDDLTEGDFFGEIELMYSVPHPASFIAEQAGEMLTLTMEAFRSVLLENERIASIIRQTAELRRERATAS